ncbi:MAG: hypothetical protein U0Q18_25505 [Bryobacteraceae bacterium]
METQQAQFDGWAKVEVMGHQSHIGYVRTEAYGGAVLFRIDTPELPEREWALEKPEWLNGEMCPAGTKVKRPAEPGHSVLVGSASIYRITPCTEVLAREVIERSRRAALQILDRPAPPALAQSNLPGEAEEQAEAAVAQFFSPGVIDAETDDDDSYEDDSDDREI